jgi:hypothetical protein
LPREELGAEPRASLLVPVGQFDSDYHDRLSARRVQRRHLNFRLPRCRLQPLLRPDIFAAFKQIEKRACLPTADRERYTANRAPSHGTRRERVVAARVLNKQIKWVTDTGRAPMILG